MEVIAGHRGDVNGQFTSQVYLNDVHGRIEVMRAAGMEPLAYALAKSNGLEELAEEIVSNCGIDPSQINVDIHDVSHDQSTPTIVNSLVGVNWPLKETSLSFFEQAILGQVDDLTLEEAEETNEASEGAAHDVLDDDAYDAYDDDIQEDAWGLDTEDIEVEEEEDDGPAEPGVSEVELWARNSPLAADHIAAGSFDTAAQILNRQLGVTNLAPLKSRFLEVYQSSKLYLTATDTLPPLPYYVRRGLNESNPHKSLPMIPGYDNLKPTLQEAFKAVMQNKPEHAIDLFRKLLYTISTLAVTSQAQVAECKRIVGICKEYILAFTIELARRATC